MTLSLARGSLIKQTSSFVILGAKRIDRVNVNETEPPSHVELVETSRWRVPDYMHIIGAPKPKPTKVKQFGF